MRASSLVGQVRRWRTRQSRWRPPVITRLCRDRHGAERQEATGEPVRSSRAWCRCARCASNRSWIKPAVSRLVSFALLPGKLPTPANERLCHRRRDTPVPGHAWQGRQRPRAMGRLESVHRAWDVLPRRLARVAMREKRVNDNFDGAGESGGSDGDDPEIRSPSHSSSRLRTAPGYPVLRKYGVTLLIFLRTRPRTRQGSSGRRLPALVPRV